MTFNFTDKDIIFCRPWRKGYIILLQPITALRPGLDLTVSGLGKEFDRKGRLIFLGILKVNIMDDVQAKQNYISVELFDGFRRVSPT